MRVSTRATWKPWFILAALQDCRPSLSQLPTAGARCSAAWIRVSASSLLLAARGGSRDPSPGPRAAPPPPSQRLTTSAAVSGHACPEVAPPAATVAAGSVQLCVHAQQRAPRARP
eukprot:364971-Chlamydomonas_euryale.AAC.15